MSDWPHEDLQLLRKLVGEGLSASQIGQRLGRSRNAVIGKIMRNKASVGKLARSSGEMNGRKVTAKQKPAPKRAYRKALPPKPLPVFERPQPYVPAKNLPATLPITFLDAMTRRRCLHFVGDPLGLDGPEMPVCGAERSEHAEGRPWCRRHLGTVYRAVAA
ncbi:hypothetical protein EN829_014935 [Mesorhizobium sp. M00.F.Ca.ET.186.01.1.1]|nr:hypothetical protein EN848_14500 [bacterium M00.F.Ca.ET.205.01.1.1]TGU52978.1 hypothetical protein EN795_14895 [bacterium M00.F.Ca.ET.152.01.1.1]TGV35947.1 hypothetical protein EN829_014935 [Mesorhizobium sp. M00.F.Ca.ET.186.01.1.1]TGZ43530.1 hypothetical protein EN805_10505 [bacterium M00.F.Ca.ET.162.01.1.1]